MDNHIPFNKPSLMGKELFYIAQSVLSGHISGDGNFTKKCNKLLEDYLSAKKVLLTNSCTSALEISAILCDLNKGDEVIMPSFTFVSTANSFYMNNAKIVFVDIDQDTLNIDYNKIEEAVTPKTKVIVPVHYAGNACEMDTILSIASKYNLLVVEDAAQALSSRYKGNYLGTIGDMGAFSFHETKNFICGEGGALVINNERFLERAEIIREKGTDRSKFFRGEVDKYTWVDVGSSHLPSDIVAAFLFAQLENIETINRRRYEIFDFYYKELMPLANDGKVRMPYVSTEVQSNCHMFYIILNTEKERDELVKYLKSKGVHAVFHYLPLHLSKIGRSFGYIDGNLPVTESMSARLLRLPFFFEISKDQQKIVVNCIKSFFNKIK